MSSSSPHTRMHGRRRGVAVALATIAALGATALTAPAAQADPGDVMIDLVTVNDFHGRIEASAPAGGIAALGTAVNKIRAENPNTVFAAAGDMIGASTFPSFIAEDVPTIDTLNQAGLDVSAVGNHEFDRGWDDLSGRVMGLADWEYIGANVYDAASNTPALPEYWTEDLDGVTIGFIGAVTEDLPTLVNPAGIATLAVKPIVDSVNAVADRLSDNDPANGEADVLVLLVHEGAPDTTLASATDESNAFGAIVNGVSDDVNAIVSGHTHLAYNHEVPYGGDTGLRPVISSGQYGEKFSDMKISVNPATKTITSIENTIYDMYTYPTGTPTPPPVANHAQDPEIAATVKTAVDSAKVLGAKPLGTITADFNRAQQPGVDSTGNPTVTDSRGAESTLGNFVADVQLWSAQQADDSTQIAFMNSGGLRTDMKYAPDGVLSYAEAAAVQPFANTLVNLTLTGADIAQALEQQWQPAGASRPFLKLGISKDLLYTFDPGAAAGAHITSITIKGEPLDPAATYRVVVNSFLAAGGDSFTAFTQGTGEADTGKVDLQSMVDYMAAFGEVAPDLAQRSIGVTLSAPGASGYVTGQQIDVDLSALEFSTTEPAAATASVSIGGVPVGDAAIDRTLVALYDQTGTASLSVTVPAGVSGIVPLTVTTPRGTAISVPITVVEPVASSTIGWPSKFIVKRGQSVSYNVIVHAGGGAVPTGTVTVYDRDQAIATIELDTSAAGRGTVALPALARGVHLLRAVYEGSDTVAGSTGIKLPLIVR